MSVTLASITSQTETTSVEIAGITVEFTYRPYVITLGKSMQLSEGNAEMIDVLADVIEGWDLTEDNDTPFPVTKENLMKLPTELATLMAAAIVGGGSEETGEAESNSAAG